MFCLINTAFILVASPTHTHLHIPSILQSSYEFTKCDTVPVCSFEETHFFVEVLGSVMNSVMRCRV